MLKENYKCLDCANQAGKNELYCFDCNHKFFEKMKDKMDEPKGGADEKGPGE